MTPFKGRNRVTSPYGWRTLRGTRQWHAGQDIVGDDDKMVRAIWDAVRCDVSYGWNGGRGNMVTLYYAKGLRVICQHLGEMMVKTGQAVRQGEAIGKMGNTGDSLGAHLHIEVQRFANGRWGAVVPAGYTEVPNTVGAYQGNERMDRAGGQAPAPASPGVGGGVAPPTRILRVGPASLGDKKNMRDLARELRLAVNEKMSEAGWILEIGPMSDGDQRTIKKRTADLRLAYEVM